MAHICILQAVQNVELLHYTLHYSLQMPVAMERTDFWIVESW